jgi:hypothetical protein
VTPKKNSAHPRKRGGELRAGAIRSLINRTQVRRNADQSTPEQFKKISFHYKKEEAHEDENRFARSTVVQQRCSICSN